MSQYSKKGQGKQNITRRRLSNKFVAMIISNTVCRDFYTRSVTILLTSTIQDFIISKLLLNLGTYLKKWNLNYRNYQYHQYIQRSFLHHDLNSTTKTSIYLFDYLPEKEIQKGYQERPKEVIFRWMHSERSDLVAFVMAIIFLTNDHHNCLHPHPLWPPASSAQFRKKRPFCSIIIA